MRVNRAVHIPYSNHATPATRAAARQVKAPSRAPLGMVSALLVAEFAVVFKLAGLLVGGAL